MLRDSIMRHCDVPGALTRMCLRVCVHPHALAAPLHPSMPPSAPPLCHPTPLAHTGVGGTLAQSVFRSTKTEQKETKVNDILKHVSSERNPETCL